MFPLWVSLTPILPSTPAPAPSPSVLSRTGFGKDENRGKVVGDLRNGCLTLLGSDLTKHHHDIRFHETLSSPRGRVGGMRREEGEGLGVDTGAAGHAGQAGVRRHAGVQVAGNTKLGG